MNHHSIELTYFQSFSVPGKYIVDTSKCRILNLSPFTEEAMNVFQRESYQTCSEIKPLVELVQFRENDTKILLIHEERKRDYFLKSWMRKIEVEYA